MSNRVRTIRWIRFVVILLLIGGSAGAGAWWFSRPKVTHFYTDGQEVWPAEQGGPLDLRTVLWEPGSPMPADFNTPEPDYQARLSPDGRELYLTRGRPGGSADIFVAGRIPGGWTPPRPIDGVNTPEHDEIGPAFSPDGQWMVFYSNRPGGQGGYDLYVSARMEGGAWSPPINLGPRVNSFANEYDPAFAPGGQVLMFASSRRTEARPDDPRWRATLREPERPAVNYDLFAAHFQRDARGNWLAGEVLPLDDLNTPGDEGQPVISPDGDYIYFASNRPGGLGGFDIYRARVAETTFQRFETPENLGRPINTEHNEMDPATSLEGFAIYFSSDRPKVGRPAVAPATQPDLAGFPDYDIFLSRSREVELGTLTRRSDLGEVFAVAPWPAIGLILSAVAMVMIVLGFLNFRQRPGLMLTLLIISLMIHLAWFYYAGLVYVYSKVQTARESSLGDVRISLNELAGGDLSAKLRSRLAEIASPNASVDAPRAREPEVAEATEPAARPSIARAESSPEEMAPLQMTDLAAPRLEPDDRPREQIDPTRPSVAAVPVTPLEMKRPTVRESEPDERPADVQVQRNPTRMQLRNPEAVPVRPAATPQRVQPAPAESQPRKIVPQPSDRPTVAEQFEAVSTPPAPRPTVAVQFEPEAPAAQPSSEPAEQPAESPAAATVAADRAQANPDAPSQNRPRIPVTAPQAAQAPSEPMVAARPADTAAPPKAADELATAAVPTVQLERSAHLAPQSAEPRPLTPPEPSTASADASAPAPGVQPGRSAAPTPEAPVAASLPVSARSRTAAIAPGEQVATRAGEPVAPRGTVINDTIGGPAPAPRPAVSDDVSVAARPDAVAPPSGSAGDAPQQASASPSGSVDAARVQTRASPAGPSRPAGPSIPTVSRAPSAPAGGLALARPASPAAVMKIEDGVAANPAAGVSTPRVESSAVAGGPDAVAPPLPGDSESAAGRASASAGDVSADRAEPTGSAAPSGRPSGPTIAARPGVAAGPSAELGPAPRVAAAPSLSHELPGGDELASVARPGPDISPLTVRMRADLPPSQAPAKRVYQLRQRADKQDVIEKLGGSKESEQAVKDALVWLARHQDEDGKWDVDQFDRHCTGDKCDGAGSRRNEDVGVTGLALLAFLGAGHTHTEDGPYRDNVARGIAWLVEGQDDAGNLRRGGQMYSQGIATMVLCEAYGLTGQAELRTPARKAVEFILAGQTSGSGWRYEPGKDSDTSVVGWQLMGIRSGLIAGFELDTRRSFLWARRWLGKVGQGRHGGQYEYQPGRGVSEAMTAEGLFCRQVIGEKPNVQRRAESVDYLMRNLPQRRPSDRKVTNFYYWYYGTLAMHAQGGPDWDRWNEKTREVVVSLQRHDGCAKGSWNPASRWGGFGGRVYSTAMAAMTLEVYYRYLPFYAGEQDGAEQE